MSDRTPIEWADATWNPVTGCKEVSRGCRNCYAARLAATRLKKTPSRSGLARRRESGPGWQWTGKARLNESMLRQPLGWRKPRTVFACAHADLFYEAVPDGWIDLVFAIMALAPQHTYQILTKRPERMRRYVSELFTGRGYSSLRIAAAVASGDPAAADRIALQFQTLMSRVWLGVSAEDAPTAAERLPALLDTPAATRFLSGEPLLGPLDCPRLDELDWIICGGESGPGHRRMDPEWARGLRDRAREAGIPFFFKQWGGATAKAGGALLDGVEWRQLPGPAWCADPREEGPA